MSKSQQTSTYNNAQNQEQQNNSNESAVNTQLQGILSTAQGNAASMLPSITGGYSDIASTGGYNPDTLNTINSTATNLATTGGFSPQQIAAMQDQSAQAAASTYETGQAAAQRTAAATGGYGNSGAIEASLARQGSNAASAGAQAALGTIAPLQQAGMEAGVGELNTTQQNMASNQLAALGGASNIYGMNEQQTTATIGQILQNYQQTGQLNNQDLSVLTNLANQPGVFSQIVNTIGTLGGAAGGILTGLNIGPGGVGTGNT